ncbi:uncharacterized protein LOC110706650 [Chenopodium quinoa]|uniref:uncharacterized protein LOC110706650 n=1 Tax=Chenopodium quinoa TaxID=63459 RepID=UPI000B78E0FC|nr:uncharacterized protein LOC110706650 [Chenopodium quinoa]
MLAWKIVHDALPSMEVLSQKGIPVNLTCVFCHNYVESRDHLFHDCPFIGSLWYSIDWGSFPKPDSLLPFLDWFMGIVSGLSSARFWAILDYFFGVCWAIWLTRNNVRFRSAVYSPNSVLALALDWSLRSQNARNLNSDSTGRPPGFPSPSTTYALCGALDDICEVSMLFDGAWDRKTNNAGTGWCFCVSDSSQPMVGGAKACVAGSALHSELLACLFGLQQARLRGFTRLLLLADCSIIPTLILCQEVEDIAVIWTIQEIRNTLSDFTTCLIRKVPRSSIREAHSLAGATRCRDLLSFVFLVVFCVFPL